GPADALQPPRLRRSAGRVSRPRATLSRCIIGHELARADEQVHAGADGTLLPYRLRATDVSSVATALRFAAVDVSGPMDANSRSRREKRSRASGMRAMAMREKTRPVVTVRQRRTAFFRARAYLALAVRQGHALRDRWEWFTADREQIVGRALSFIMETHA